MPIYGRLHLPSTWPGARLNGDDTFPVRTTDKSDNTRQPDDNGSRGAQQNATVATTIGVHNERRAFSFRYQQQLRYPVVGGPANRAAVFISHAENKIDDAANRRR